MKVRILTPEWNKSFDAEAVFLPGAIGEFEVLENHAPIISALTSGAVKWRSGGRLESQLIKGGIARVSNNEIEVCVEV